MESKFKRILLTIPAISLLLSSVLFTSCSKAPEEMPPVGVDGRTVFVYSSVSVDFYEPDYSFYAKKAYSDGESIYVFLEKYANDLSSYCQVIRKLTTSGEFVSDTELCSLANPSCTNGFVKNSIYYYTTQSNCLIKLDLNTGEEIGSVQFNSSIYGVNECDDGYILLCQGYIEKYNDNDESVGRIDNNSWQFYNASVSYYSQSGKEYLISDLGFHYKYYELDFEEGTSHLVFDPSSLDTKIYGCSGEFIFDNKGEYLFDFESSSMIPLAVWNEMNLRPSEYSWEDPVYIGVDNEHFIQLYSYQNGISQLVYYTYECDEDYSARQELIIGGFDCREDPALNWAVYQYNTSQNEYRAYIEDYSEQFDFGSSTEDAANQAALIQYFNDGNAPDLFYGNFFDYDSFAGSGMTLEISQYMDSTFRAKFDNITQSIRNLMMDEDGNCYKIFSGYQIEGYFASTSLIGDITDMSMEEAVATAEELEVTPFDWARSSYLVHDAIFYSVHNEDLTPEDIEMILELSVENGYEDFTSVNHQTLARSTVNDCLLWKQTIFCLSMVQDYSRDTGEFFTYVGYPSVNGSVHPVQPFGQMAISASTMHPEECATLLSFLLDEEVQFLNINSSLFPVDDTVLNNYLYYASHNNSIPDEDYIYASNYEIERGVSEDIADRIRGYINLVDSIEYHDWGLNLIIEEEVESYYSMNRPVDVIAESLYSRINLYLDEEG